MSRRTKLLLFLAACVLIEVFIPAEPFMYFLSCLGL